MRRLLASSTTAAVALVLAGCSAPQSQQAAPAGTEAQPERRHSRQPPLLTPQRRPPRRRRPRRQQRSPGRRPSRALQRPAPAGSAAAAPATAACRSSSRCGTCTASGAPGRRIEIRPPDRRQNDTRALDENDEERRRVLGDRRRADCRGRVDGHCQRRTGRWPRCRVRQGRTNQGEGEPLARADKPDRQQRQEDRDRHLADQRRGRGRTRARTPRRWVSARARAPRSVPSPAEERARRLVRWSVVAQVRRCAVTRLKFRPRPCSRSSCARR